MVASLGNEAIEPYFRAKSTQLIVDETIQFIRQHRETPFYVNVWTLLPHALLKPTPEQLQVYAELQTQANDPAFGPWMQKYLANAKDLRSQMQVFCASLTDLDTQVGRLLDALDEMKLAEDTLIFFSSDNGPEDYRIGTRRTRAREVPASCADENAACMKAVFALLGWCAGQVKSRPVEWTKQV
jgi:arylsulfatase A-like enzyme